MLRRFIFLVQIAFVALLVSALAQTPHNPILFVTVVPNAQDSATQSAVFCSHLSGVRNAPRGGDLWIRYPDGSLKNLTKLAGYGNDGVQAEKSIAVREPSVHWNGTRAMFSMIVGSPLSATDQTKFYWQMYEITGLGKDESPVITKVPNQPLANNISPTYGTDGKVVFISDAPRIGDENGYQYLDENIAMLTNSGVWSLDPANGNLRHLDHAPSGAFSPFVDSYGRVLFTRWDILQQDQMNFHARDSVPEKGTRIGIRYNDESTSSPFGVGSGGQEDFPEFNRRLLSGRGGGYFENPDSTSDTIPPPSLLDPHCPSNFFPWAINEDGSNAQTINHIGRHDLIAEIPALDSDSSGIQFDKNLMDFESRTSSRANKNPLVNLLTMKEDPNAPGTLYGIDAPSALTHSSGQIVRLNNVKPTDASNAVTVSYITARSTRDVIPPGKQAPSDHSGFYRNPLPTTDGLLIASHSSGSGVDNPAPNGGINAFSTYAYRLKTLKPSGSVMVPNQLLTNGISKQVILKDYMAPAASQTITVNGVLWEMDAVEVVARTAPAQRSAKIDPLEKAVFDEEKVDVPTFQRYLEQSNQALIVSRDITIRDKDDKQQPYYLRVEGTTKTTPGASGTIYPVSKLSVFQADYRRGYEDGKGTILDNSARRTLPTPLHDGVHAATPAPLQADGSFAKFVPAGRALSWQLSNNANKAVVRERFWVTFKAGEIRACVKCHGENGEASVLSNPVPQNKSEGLRTLLHTWKTENYPSRIQQTLPLHQSVNNVFPLNLQWKQDDKAQKYEIIVKAYEGTQLRVVYTKTVDAPTTSLLLQESDLQTSAKQFQWEVRGVGEWGTSETVSPFNFATDGVLSVGETGESPELKLEPNPASGAVRIRFSINESSAYTVLLTDMLGRNVMMNTYGAEGREIDTELQVHGLAEGIYIVRVQYGQGEYRRRLVISR